MILSLPTIDRLSKVVIHSRCFISLLANIAFITSIFHTFPLDCHKTSKGQSDPPCTASTNRKASKDRKQKGKRQIGNTTEQENSENPIKIQKTENQKNTQKTEKPKNSVEKGKAVEVPKRRDDVKEGMNKIIY